MRTTTTRQTAATSPHGVRWPVVMIVALSLSAPTEWVRVCHAGGGPENVLLVVNSRSWASRTIANHYVDLRFIPRTNVLLLDWAGSVEKTDIATFRTHILTPIIKAIDKRGLSAQIDYIVYSSDFPYEIDFSAELDGKFMSGSLTSLTFLYESTMNGETNAFPTPINWYANTQSAGRTTRGFSNQKSWSGPRTSPLAGRRYMLSTMLGYTSGGGNALEDVVDYLQRSALADGTHPNGTVCFMKHEDIRSKTRAKYFDAVAGALRREGARAEIIDGILPKNKQDIIGAMLGKANFRWASASSRFLPGAICENLTSFGAILSGNSRQSTLSEVMKYGLAGSSGTVIEPYANPLKFPHPVIHLHYYRGCSMAEAFYQSVRAPYQLLIVGDPLCKPYAKIPVVSVDGLKPNEEVQGEVTVTPAIVPIPGQNVARYDCFIDGIKKHSCLDGNTFGFDSNSLPQGHHELRIVAVMDDAIQTQGRSILPFRVRNQERKISVKQLSPSRLTWDEQVQLEVSSPGARRLVVFHNNNLVTQFPGESGILRFTPKKLGLGPVQLLVGGVGDSRLGSVFATPIKMTIGPGPLLRARPKSVGVKLEDGIELTLVNGQKNSVPSTKHRKWLQRAGVKPNQPFTITSSFSVPRTAVYQFQAELRGGIQLLVDGNTLLRLNPRTERNRYEIPVYLEAGTHRLRLNAVVSKPPRMKLKFGEFGTKFLEGPTFQRLP